MNNKNSVYCLLNFIFYSLLFSSSQASMDKLDFQTELSANSMDNKFGLGAKYDFGTISAESSIFVNNDSNIELGSYLVFDYGLSNFYDLSYGLGYFKSEINSGMQSKLELSYKLSESTKIYSYFSLRQGSDNSDINTWVGLGIRWSPFNNNIIVSSQLQNQNLDVPYYGDTILGEEKVMTSINNIEPTRKVKILQYGSFNSDLDESAIRWLYKVSRKFIDKPLKVYEFIPGKPVLATQCEMNDECSFDEELFIFFERYRPFIHMRYIDEVKLNLGIEDYILSNKD